MTPSATWSLNNLNFFKCLWPNMNRSYEKCAPNCKHKANYASGHNFRKMLIRSTRETQGELNTTPTLLSFIVIRRVTRRHLLTRHLLFTVPEDPGVCGHAQRVKGDIARVNTCHVMGSQTHFTANSAYPAPPRPPDVRILPPH